MTYPKRELKVIPECNDENDNPCCWSMLVCEDGDGKRHYLWITKYDEGYIVEDSNGNNITDGKVYKTLWGAKKAAEGIAWRQEESGFFTD